MRIELIHSMTPEEAHEYFDRFLEAERPIAEQLQSRAISQGVPYNYMLDSIPLVVLWPMQGIHASRVPVPSSEPWWIQKAHQGGLLEFEDDAKSAILRSAYYLGESFVRAFQILRWRPGGKKYT